jgi:hypothetical protein
MNPAITTIPSTKVESRHGMSKKLVVMVNMAEKISPASHAQNPNHARINPTVEFWVIVRPRVAPCMDRKLLH